MKKLPFHTVQKMMDLYAQGKSQAEIAAKLGLDQSTVSKQVKKFASLAQTIGTKAAAEEYVVDETIHELHALGAELGKHHLTPGQAKAGLKMMLAFEKHGIPQEAYEEGAKAIARMKSEGFLPAALKLAKLETDWGVPAEAVVAKASEAHQDLEQTMSSLVETTQKKDVAATELADVLKQKAAVLKDLQKQMEQAGVDLQRLKLVEGLAVALKTAGVSNSEIGTYIARQKILNNAGFDISLLAKIIGQAQMVTSLDQGKSLLGSLKEYGGLVAACSALEAKRKALNAEVQGLEKLAARHGQLQVAVQKLNVEKASLLPHVQEALNLKGEVEGLQASVKGLSGQRTALAQEIAAREKESSGLSKEIVTRQEQVSDLETLGKKRQALLGELAEADARVKARKGQWTIFEGFLGLVQEEAEDNTDKLEIFRQVLPDLIEQVKKGTYPPFLLKDQVLRTLGFRAQVWKCVTCGLRFGVDGKKAGGYHCPSGLPGHQAMPEKEAAPLLRALIAPKTITNSTTLTPEGSTQGSVPPGALPGSG